MFCAKDRMILAWFIFLYLRYPKNCVLMKEGIVISEPPSTYAF